MKSFREGGVTYSQFMFLHQSATEQKERDDEFLAAVHGINLRDPASVTEQKPSPSSPKVVESPNNMMFADPSEYEHLSEEERDKLTKEMMKHWSPFVATSMKTPDIIYEDQ